MSPFTILRTFVAICLLQVAAHAFAEDDVIIPIDFLPNSKTNQLQHQIKPVGADCSDSSCCSLPDGPFLSLGGSYNSVRISQGLTGTTTSNVAIGSTLVASGPSGSASPTFQDTLQTFAPLAQIGYLQNIGGTDWAWGTKFTYKYLGSTFTDPNPISPQASTLTPTGASPDTFTGHVTASSELIEIDHQLALLPFVAHSFDRGRIYFGAGPVVFSTQTHLYDVTGYTDINGVHSDVTGSPVDLAASTWMWGAIGELGITYYVRPACYAELSYDAIITGSYSKQYSTPFTSQSGGFTTTGTANISAVQHLTAQSLNFTLVRLF
jgi:hypothetical protein